MGLQSLSYYAALSWLPTLFRDRGASAVHAGTLLALMGLGNAVTAWLVPLAAHRLPDQRVLAAVWMVVTAAGLAGAAFAPMGAAAAFSFVLGLGQGASLGLAIFYTVARAPDPVTAASLSGFAQSLGYLVATHRAAAARPAAQRHRRLGHPGHGPARRGRPSAGNGLAGRAGADGAGRGRRAPAGSSVTAPATPC